MDTKTNGSRTTVESRAKVGIQQTEEETEMDSKVYFGDGKTASFDCDEYDGFYTFPAFGELELWGDVDIADVLRWDAQVQAFRVCDAAINRLDRELESVDMPGFADAAYDAAERAVAWFEEQSGDVKKAFYCAYLRARKLSGDLGDGYDDDGNPVGDSGDNGDSGDDSDVCAAFDEYKNCDGYGDLCYPLPWDSSPFSGMRTAIVATDGESVWVGEGAPQNRDELLRDSLENVNARRDSALIVWSWPEYPFGDLSDYEYSEPCALKALVEDKVFVKQACEAFRNRNLHPEDLKAVQDKLNDVPVRVFEGCIEAVDHLEGVDVADEFSITPTTTDDELERIADKIFCEAFDVGYVVVGDLETILEQARLEVSLETGCYNAACCDDVEGTTYPAFGELERWGDLDVLDVVRWDGETLVADVPRIRGIAAELDDAGMDDAAFIDAATEAADDLETWLHISDDDEAKCALLCEFWKRQGN